MTDQIQAPIPNVTWIKVGVFFSTLAVIIIFCVFGFGYFQLAKVNMTLAQQVSDLHTKVETSTQQIQLLEGNVNNLHSAGEHAQELVSKQEQMITDWQAAQKGNLSKWYVAEAQYLVRLANDYAQYMHNLTVAQSLLQRADQILQNVQDAAVMDIRKSLATDLTGIRSLPQVNITELYVQLAGLNGQIDQLPLPFNPLKPNTATASSAENPDPNLSWWQKGLNQSWLTLKQIVIVRNTASTTLPLVLPDEKNFLYQNLHAEMENAMWAVLHRNPEVYQASLTRLISWIQQYFVQTAPATVTMLQGLQSLQAMNIQAQAVNFDNTLHFFDAYFNNKAETA